MPIYKRRLPGQPGLDASDMAGMPLEAPVAIAGAVSKLGPEALMEAHDLLGRTMQLGKRLVRLSSADPATDKAIMHTSFGERLTVPLSDFLHQVREVVSPEDPFPEGGVVTASGIPTPKATLGPKGGVIPKRGLP